MKGQAGLWWREVELRTGQTGCWRIGPLTLWAKRLEREWQTARLRDEAAADAGDGSFTIGEEAPDAGPERRRFVFGQAPARIRAAPLLPDRPLVLRPATPFHVPGGQQATLYVSTPLWVRLQVGAPPVTLEELAVQRPSDTWSGAVTGEGELCYAGRTRARVRLEEVPPPSYRAIIPVTVKNASAEPLVLDRLKLPVANLPLFGERDGSLWTPPVAMTRERNGDTAALELGLAPPPEARRATQLAEPRQRAESGVVMRALSALFG